jgi:hypothetical protein
MYLEEPAGKAVAALPRIGREMLIPALICAGVSVILMQAGFLTFFFLVPLGVCAVVCGPAAAWLGAACAVAGNGLWTAGLSLRYGGFSHIGIDMLYFAVLSLGFTWVMAGKEPWFHPPRPAIPLVRTAFRLIAASAAGALVFLAMALSLNNDEGFSAGIRSQIEAFAASYIAASGTDAAQRAFLEQTLTADRVIGLFLMVFFRGGALFLALFQLFFNRQMAFVIARLFKRYSRQQQQRQSDLIGFHVPRTVIWVLSLCLPVILLCRTASWGMIEIAAWNILVLCATMFLAQGSGIVLFHLARRPVSMAMRLIGIVLLVCVIFSPGINVLALTILILLGVAENWLPLRVERQGTPGIDG